MGRVTFRNVNKLYAGAAAVRDSNLEINDGEFVVLVGPSGCGKSTSLRMIAGLERPTSGRIYIGDEDVTNLHPRARNIAMVFQDYALYPHMSVKQNLAFGLRNLNYPKAEIDRRVGEAIRALSIEALTERLPKQLSGGQRQRVALGRAMVREPDVFLLDEPLSNLDARMRVQMRVEIAELQRRLGTTTVYVTHDQEEAMTLGHRIVVMRDGAIQQMDAPDHLYAQPRNVFVARFIGSPPMNVFPGELRANGDQLAFHADSDDVLPIPPSARPALESRVGQRLYLGVRPEHIVPATPGAHAEDIVLEVDVKLVEMLGPQRLVYFPFGGEMGVAAFSADTSVKATERVRIAWLGHKLQFFDGETEERLRLEREAVAYS